MFQEYQVLLFLLFVRVDPVDHWGLEFLDFHWGQMVLVDLILLLVQIHLFDLVALTSQIHLLVQESLILLLVLVVQMAQIHLLTLVDLMAQLDLHEHTAYFNIDLILVNHKISYKDKSSNLTLNTLKIMVVWG